MQQQRVTVWTGGQPWAQESLQLAEAIPVLPAPAPLRRSALIEFCWGTTHFQFLVVAGSIRTASWGVEPMHWLHCKARQTAEIQSAGEPTDLMNYLIPAHYITRIEPGPKCQIVRSHTGDPPVMGVFPPNQPAPPAAVPLDDIDQAIAKLLAPQLN